MKIKVKEIKSLNDVAEDFQKGAREAGVTDADETMVLARQMEIIKAMVLEKKYQDLIGRGLVPKSPDGDNASDYVVVRYMDEFTTSKIVENYGTDFPSVSMSMSESFAKYFSLGNSFNYSFMDLRKAAKAGVQLSSRLAEIARRGIEQGIDDIIFRGVPQNGTYGLMNNPNVPLVVLPHGDWPHASFQNIVEDLMYLSTVVQNSTNETFSGDTLAIDAPSYNIAATKIGGQNYDRSALQVFLAQNPSITAVVKSTKLNTLGASAGPRGIVYKRDPEVLQLEIGQEFEMLPAETNALITKTACHARCAGVSFFHPLAAAYFENHRTA
jgi:hypothetical protein